VILATASYLTSRTLYNLRKSVHHAKRLGNYLIKEELGQGGMGKVFLAEHALICRPTAVKVYEAADSESMASLTRFEQEVQLSANLTHPNTINIYDYGRTGGNIFFYAMEYLDGLDLQRFVEKFGPVEPARAIYILKQACGSLAEAHAFGIIHRDIKPSNLFLTQRGGLCDFLKVLDFGLAKQFKTNGSVSVTKSGVLFGTPRYIAPESIYGNEVNDARSDLYNLGGVAYWLLTGQPPFKSSSSLELLVDHVKTPPQRPSEVYENPIPQELEDIVMKCLAKKPGDRFQSVTELMEVLDSLPCSEDWDEKKARQWWELHGLWKKPEVCARCSREPASLPIA
jgi:serine/threonine-protein kinase